MITNIFSNPEPSHIGTNFQVLLSMLQVYPEPSKFYYQCSKCTLNHPSTTINAPNVETKFE